MKKPLDEIKFGNYENNEFTLTISVYEEFVLAVVSLTSDESFEALQLGGVPEERCLLIRRLRKIFNEPFDGLKMFSDIDDYIEWKKATSFEIPSGDAGTWCKTAVFILNQLNYELTLEKTISYIKDMYSDYKNPRGKQESIAKSVLSKYFRNSSI